jgi:hypothetical protein
MPSPLLRRARVSVNRVRRWCSSAHEAELHLSHLTLDLSLNLSCLPRPCLSGSRHNRYWSVQGGLIPQSGDTFIVFDLKWDPPDH